MKFEEKHKSPIKIEKTEEILKIYIPAKNEYLLAAVMAFFVGIFALGIYVAISSFISSIPTTIEALSGNDGYIPFSLLIQILIFLWFTGWLIAGVRNFKELVLSLWGLEEIIINDESLTISKHSKLFSQKKSFPSDDIKRLRFSKSETSSNNRFLNFIANYSGFLAFDYGAKTIKFVNTDEESIAYDVLEEIIKVKPEWKLTD